MLTPTLSRGFTGAYQIFHDHVDGIRVMIALYIDL